MRNFIKAFIVHKLNAFYPNWAIIQAKQDFSMKPHRYMVVDMLDEQQVGDQQVLDYKEEKLYISGIRESTINVQAFGENAVEALSRLWLLLQRPSVVDEFWEKNIAILSAGAVKDLTALLDNRSWQQRASIDLTVSFSREVEDVQPFFDGIENGIQGYIGHENIYDINDKIIVTNSDYQTVKDIETKDGTVLVTTEPIEPSIETIVPADQPIIDGNIPYKGYINNIKVIGGNNDINNIEIPLEIRS